MADPLPKIIYCYEGFDLTEVTKKRIVYQDMTPCSQFHRRFGGTCYFHFQGRIIGKQLERSEEKAESRLRQCVSSEMSDKFYRTSRLHIPEDNTLQCTCIRHY